MELKLHGSSESKEIRLFLDSHWTFIYLEIKAEMLILKQSIAKYQSVDVNIPRVLVWAERNTLKYKMKVFRVNKFSITPAALILPPLFTCGMGKPTVFSEISECDIQTQQCWHCQPRPWDEVNHDSGCGSCTPTLSAEICDFCTKWSSAKSCHTVRAAWRCRQMHSAKKY